MNNFKQEPRREKRKQPTPALPTQRKRQVLDIQSSKENFNLKQNPQSQNAQIIQKKPQSRKFNPYKKDSETEVSPEESSDSGSIILLDSDSDFEELESSPKKKRSSLSDSFSSQSSNEEAEKCQKMLRIISCLPDAISNLLKKTQKWNETEPEIHKICLIFEDIIINNILEQESNPSKNHCLVKLSERKELFKSLPKNSLEIFKRLKKFSNAQIQDSSDESSGTESEDDEKREAESLPFIQSLGDITLVVSKQVKSSEEEKINTDPNENPRQQGGRLNIIQSKILEKNNQIKKTLPESLDSHKNSSPAICFGISSVLKNFGGVSFMNSLFQSLYDLEPFREIVLSLKPNETPSFIKNLKKLFCKMKCCHLYTSSTQLDQEHRKLVEAIYQRRPEFKPNIEGDSGFLFDTILEELFFWGDLRKNQPQERLSDGRYTPRIQYFCRSPEHEKMSLFEVRDPTCLSEKQEDSFSHPTRAKFCFACLSKVDPDCSNIADSLPQLLAIRILNTKDSKMRVRVLPKIYLNQANKTGKLEKKVQYELVSSVLKCRNDKNEVSFIALSNQQNKYYYMYFDKVEHLVRQVPLNGLPYQPQLLFYRKVHD